MSNLDAYYAGLRTLCKQADNVERVKTGLENSISRFKADGWPDLAFAWSEEQIPALKRVLRTLMRQVAEAGKASPFADWISGTPGLGPGFYRVIAFLPPLHEMRSPSKVWRYAGLDVRGGMAPVTIAGVQSGFSPRLRSYALVRLALPCVYHRTSPYRRVYESRRARTLETHPVMLGKGGGCSTCDQAYKHTKARRGERALTRERTSAVGYDCSAHGGVHWSPAHRHRDALRVTAKSILRDAWRIAHGLEPIFGR